MKEKTKTKVKTKMTTSNEEEEEQQQQQQQQQDEALMTHDVTEPRSLRDSVTSRVINFSWKTT